MAANRATISELSGLNAVRFAVNPTVNISKGDLLKLSGDFAVLASAGADLYAGVAAEDHAAKDADTEISVHIPGRGNIFEMTASTAAIPLGSHVLLSGANVIQPFTAVSKAKLSGGYLIGTALEAASASEVIRVLS